MSAHPARLRVGIIGSGRVGSAVGVALLRSGHEVVAVAAVSDESLRRAERRLPGAEVLAPDDVIAAADFVLLAVPDDALGPLVAGLADVGAWRSGQLVAHTSGAQGIGILNPAAARGVLALALHPVMTFTGREEDIDRLDGATWGVTAPEESRPVAEALVLDMGGEPVWVPESARALYHAALTIASNHIVTLINDALEVLDDAGVEASARLLAPLAGASLDNVLRLGDAALTGPIVRGDIATVRAHVQVLAAVAPPIESAYRAMARRTTQRAVASGRLSAGRGAELIELLER